MCLGRTRPREAELLTNSRKRAGAARSRPRQGVAPLLLHPGQRSKGEIFVSTTLLFILLIVLLLAALPAWPYSRGWGYYPSGGLGLVLVVVLLLVFTGVV